MLAELNALLAAVPVGVGAVDNRDAIFQRKVLGKATDTTRKE